MKIAPFIAPVLGIAVTTSASIAFDGIADKLVPTDLKAIPAFGIKVGVAIVGGLLAGKIAQIVVDNVEAVRLAATPASEEIVFTSDQEESD